MALGRHGHHRHHGGGFRGYGGFPWWYGGFPYQVIEEPTDVTYCARHKDLCPADCPFRTPLRRRVRAPITAPAGAGLWGSSSGNFGSLGTEPAAPMSNKAKAAVGVGAALLLWLALS